MFRVFYSLIYLVHSRFGLTTLAETTNDTLSAYRLISYRLTDSAFVFLAECRIKSAGTPLTHSRLASWTCTGVKQISQAVVFRINRYMGLEQHVKYVLFRTCDGNVQDDSPKGVFVAGFTVPIPDKNHSCLNFTETLDKLIKTNKI